MKASLRVILITVLTVSDCIIGGTIIKDSLVENNIQKKELWNLSATQELEETELALVMQEATEEETELALVMQEATEEESEIKEEGETVQEELPIELVYEGMTLDELAAQLNRSLKGEIANQGYLIASYSLEKDVDPYIATAIMLLETGCNGKCSTLVTKCHNVGGQVGTGCGKYRSFETLEAGIKGFIDNLSKNYFSKGLDTPKEINKKYATSKEWYKKVESYIKTIKNK